MSTIEVNKITPVSGGSAIQVGESGDTINIPSGATLANAGSVTGLPASAISSGVIASARLGTGTASSSTVLYGDGTFKAEPSGALTKVGSSTTLRSSHADADIPNCFSTTYDAYLITFAITNDRDGNEVRFRFVKSDGTTQNSDYDYHNFGYPSNSTSISQQNGSSTATVQLSGSTMGNTSSIMWSCWGSMWVYRPMGTTEFKPYVYTSSWYNTSGYSIPQSGGGRNGQTTAFTGIRFLPSANYFFTSDVHVYGLET